MLVLREYGMSYHNSLSKGIGKITKVTSTGFRIENSDNLYDFFGNIKRASSRGNIGSIDKCCLITLQTALDIRKMWANNNRIKQSKKLLAIYLSSIHLPEHGMKILKTCLSINCNQLLTQSI